MIKPNKSLMDRLSEIMPKHVTQEPPWAEGQMLRIREYPVRRSAESFIALLDGSPLPANREEMVAFLWTFGEITQGHLEQRLALYQKLNDDWLDNFISPLIVRMPHESSSDPDAQ